MCSELELICILEQLEKAFSDKKADIYLYYDHAKLIASKLGLQTHTLNREELLNCLTYIYRNCCNIDSVKTDDSTYLWFCLANRPARAEDALDIYKFKHQLSISLVTKMKTFDFNQYIQITGVNKFTTSNLKKKWETTESVVIPQLRCWWNDKLQDTTTTVLTWVNGEYNIYYHHQQIMEGCDNYEWLRKMYHRNKTGFCHIDVNVPDAITTGRSVNMIQEFLILTAEEPGDCTEILPEMHNHVEN
ncbi:conserved hypothetical protein [Coccidioides posadasii str. Silveira]|uniref:Uncharacterized protein n=1 Tax=Coccidioides posadasii (strain RMSCC 757 / Silveira) TaxID=443226 RepID=E9DGZ1_COCPS|nr:conserved hypothetical protein [Coccidioides posadasii str. Silveira]